MLTSAKVLILFDPKKELLLPRLMGLVLCFHWMEDGSEKPIAFAARSLSQAERKYSQLEKEGLAVVFGVSKFQLYLLDRTISPMASSRIQCWALTLSAYCYQIEFKPGSQQGNVDALSRLPLDEAPKDFPVPGDTICLMEALDSCGPVTAAVIKSWTDKDPVLSRVRNLVRHGNWSAAPQHPDFQPFLQRQLELSVEGDCLLWGCRVVEPKAGRAKVLEMLHDSHPGITRMKAIARSTVWWPGIDNALAAKVKTCQACQSNRKSPPLSLLHPWEFPARPWSCFHVDFPGPFLGKQFLVYQILVARVLQKRDHDSHARPRSFQFGDPVYVRNFNGSPQWVVEGFSKLALLVKMQDGRTCRRHIDHVRPHAVAFAEEEKLGRMEGESNLVDFLPDLAFSVEREAELPAGEEQTAVEVQLLQKNNPRQNSRWRRAVSEQVLEEQQSLQPKDSTSPVAVVPADVSLEAEQPPPQAPPRRSSR
ncbi:hypothetical protein EMCRGX_G020594 [Ephydatia muelleri]